MERSLGVAERRNAGQQKGRSGEEGHETAERRMKLKELLFANLHGLKKFEIKRRLRSERDVAIAGEPSAAGSRSSPDESADGRTFAAARESADCCASGRAAANHRSGALAFALAGHGGRRSLDLIVPARDGDAGQLEHEGSPAFEAPCGLGIPADTIRTGILGNSHFSSHLDGGFNGSGKIVAGTGRLRADGLVENNLNYRVRRYDQGLWFKRPFYHILGGFRDGRR